MKKIISASLLIFFLATQTLPQEKEEEGKVIERVAHLTLSLALPLHHSCLPESGLAGRGEVHGGGTVRQRPGEAGFSVPRPPRLSDDRPLPQTQHLVHAAAPFVAVQRARNAGADAGWPPRGRPSWA